MSRGDDPDHKYEKERQRVKDSDLSERDKESILEFLSAFDEHDLNRSYQNEKGETETLSYNSLEGYGRGVRLIAQNSECDLINHSLESLKDVFSGFLRNLAKQTVRQRQAGAIKFYRYHDADIDPEKIPLTKRDDNGTVDERDMFTKEEVHQLREACSNTRDRALLELLIYTGQRIRAIQTLRVRDIDLDEGVYYLNTEEIGLKGADKVGKKRPLLGAEKAVQNWIEHHPTGKGEDFLITPLPSATNTTDDPGDYLSAPAMRNRLWTMAEEAGVYDKKTKKGKPPNPHNFRHYFVTTCIRDYDMDEATVKHLIGHGPGSNIMETTYQHLSDEDHINAARMASDTGREPEEQEGPLTPEVCPTCKENLAPNSKACPSCGDVFTPDAKSAQQKMQEQSEESIPEVENEQEARVVQAVLKDLRENANDVLED